MPWTVSECSLGRGIHESPQTIPLELLREVEPGLVMKISVRVRFLYIYTFMSAFTYICMAFTYVIIKYKYYLKN